MVYATIFYAGETSRHRSTMKVEHRRWSTIFYAGGEVEYEKYTILYAVPSVLQKSK